MALKKAMTGPTEETPGTTFDFYWFILWIYIWTSWSATFLTVSEDQPPITINVPPGIGLGRVTGGQTARGLRGIGGGIWRSCEMRFGPSYAIVSRISGKALASENLETSSASRRATPHASLRDTSSSSSPSSSSCALSALSNLLIF
jgi:hypothetical protein